jgi:uncharacterized repeat protein (TIGR01451 family)
MVRRLVVFTVVVWVCLVCAVEAGAALPTPAWKVTSLSEPTSFSASDPFPQLDVYLVRVTNVGNGPSDGTPIVVSDALPASLSFNPSSERFKLGDYRYAYEDGLEEGVFSCSEGPPVSCSDGDVLRPGDSLYMTVPVTVATGAPASVLNAVSVSGGGAASASASETTAIGATPGFAFQGFDGGLLDTEGSSVSQAGSHPYAVRLELQLNTLPASNAFHAIVPVENTRQLTVNFPAGLVIDPNATTRCTEAQLESDQSGAERTNGCPDSSAVGLITPTLNLSEVPIPGASPLYNMVPPPGVPAEFAFDAAGIGAYIHVVGGVRTGGDYGLYGTANDILEAGEINSATVELWGDPSDPSHDLVRGRCAERTYVHEVGLPCSTAPVSTPFLTLPSACSGPLTSTVSSNSWEEPGNFAEDSFATHDVAGGPLGVTGCGKLAFNPSLNVHPETQAGGSPSGLNVDLRLPQKESLEHETQELLAEANLKKAVVTLPAGVTVSPSVANGLGACTPEEIALSSKEKPSCPDSSKVGSAEVITPLLSHPAGGSLYVAQQGNNPFGSLVALYLVVEADGAIIKLPGEVSLDPVTGQVTTTFDKSPQLPFSELKLHIFGGPRAALVTPSGCGSYTTTGQLTPWSSETAFESNSSFQVTGGCGAQGFGPSFSAGTADNQAGGFSPFSVTISRNDGEQALGAVTVTTPPGLLGVIKGVERCPEPQASQGTCGQGSLIGHTTATAGVGPDPVSVTGQVFLTGGYKGAPFGLSIVVPAVAGPFNLGNVVVRASVSVDRSTGQITIVSDPLPTILQGVPLDVRTVNVTVDRSGFMFNPTSCDPLAVTGTLTSAQGASTGVSSRFQAAGCAGLGFHPSFTASTQAATSKKNGASLDVKVGYPTGSQANIRSTAVVLPKQLPARLTTIQQACPEAVFNANPAGCPVGSDIGTATATTPVLAGSLSGPAYLVSHGGAAFPDVTLVLQGEGVTLVLVGSVDIKHGITSSDFASIPDAPISSFELNLPEGPHSGLTAVLPAKAKGSLCGTSLSMPTTITAQDGAQITQNTKIQVTGCGKAKPTRKAHGKKKAKKHARAHGKKAGRKG